MDKVQVIYWSQTGNTEAMAKAIGEGISSMGVDAEVVDVGSASIDSIKSSNVFALGCPSMGVEVLEEEEMEPFVAEVEKVCLGKKIALFGSYGWGDGEWMRDWVARMSSAGADIVGGEGLMCQDAPDDDMIEACKRLGVQLVN